MEMAYIGWAILIVLVLWVIVILIRGAMFKPYPEPETLPGEVHLNREKIISDMQEMIRCKTVSHSDESLTDFTEFEKFRALLEEKFPLVHQHAAKELIGKTGVLYCIKGEKSDAPTVCMAHYDVVPGNEEGW